MFVSLLIVVCVALALLLVHLFLTNKDLRDELAGSEDEINSLDNRVSKLLQEIGDLRATNDQQRVSMQDSRDTVQKLMETIACRDQQVTNQREAIRDYHNQVVDLSGELEQALEFYGAVEDLVKAEQPRRSPA